MRLYYVHLVLVVNGWHKTSLSFPPSLQVHVVCSEAKSASCQYIVLQIRLIFCYWLQLELEFLVQELMEVLLAKLVVNYLQNLMVGCLITHVTSVTILMIDMDVNVCSPVNELSMHMYVYAQAGREGASRLAPENEQMCYKQI